MTTLYDQCYKAFKAKDHEHNGKGHIYVNVNATIQRLNELVYPETDEFLGSGHVGWNFNLKHFHTDISPRMTSSGKAQYDAFCVGELNIPSLGTRMGTGADTNADLDTASKSAQAYALRKAANQFGVAMYLLRQPQQEDELVELLNRNSHDDPVAMKEAVILLMGIRGLAPNKLNLESEFKLEIADGDDGVFRRILEQENRI